MAKLLYLSCHSIAEFLEVKLFRELGFEVFSHGSYADGKGDGSRPELTTCGESFVNSLSTNPKENMSRDFLSQFDIIVSSWMPNWIYANWDKMSDKLVILRTIGQSTSGCESEMKQYVSKGMKIVRYSPREKVIPGYAGEDAIIRFGLDPHEFKGYTGDIKQVITVAQNMAKREPFCGYGVFKSATDGLPAVLYGKSNDGTENWGGQVSYDELRDIYKKSRVYFSTGTWPASYTLNFMEAMMTGIPIVAVGEKKGNPIGFMNQMTYEIPDIVENGVNGFISDDILCLHDYCDILLEHPDLAKKIGKAGRQKAIELFGVDKIKEEWRSFFRKEG